MKIEIEDLKFDAAGLVPVVVQDARTREVLTLAYANAESLARTVATGETWLWSRSRGELWHKGATSGNTQRVRAVVADCDSDAVTMQVEPSGPACHTGARTCFHREVFVEDGAAVESGTERGAGASSDGVEGRYAEPPTLGATLEELHATVAARRREMPAGSYTTYLFAQGIDKILKKVGEESAETIIAAKNDDAAALASEVSDLIYHLTVLLVERGVTWEAVRGELARREGKRKGQS